MPWRDEADPMHAMMRWLSDHLIDIKSDLSHINSRMEQIDSQIGGIHRQLAAGHQRMNRIEKQPLRGQQPAKSASRIERATAGLKALQEFGQAVASLKEWAAGAMLVAGSATAVCNPDWLVPLLRWLIEKLGG